jgi:hypothetical protein
MHDHRKADVEKSTEYLTKYLAKVSDKEGHIQYARACSALGFIQNTLVSASERDESDDDKEKKSSTFTSRATTMPLYNR